MKANYLANRESIRVYNKQWTKKNREHLRNYHAEYRQSDMPGAIHMREKAKEYSTKYRVANPDRSREQNRLKQQRRRSNTVGIPGPSLSMIAFNDDDLCAICGLPLEAEFELDHIVPLSRGGEHVISNMRRLHSHCNRAKSHRLDDEMSIKTTMRCRDKTLAILGHAYKI